MRTIDDVWSFREFQSKVKRLMLTHDARESLWSLYIAQLDPNNVNVPNMVVWQWNDQKCALWLYDEFIEIFIRLYEVIRT